ncbi:hypothetical protein Bca52824_051521 [Brassica carinata]|uniref:Legume lectin domain-containing protein n=1 Tax=Brassica carinata TaxID=52824 RepID=A0A8X7R1V8_BRACI|nr:hypothetical protein Bca52824_051521 [Brassica carinata]
MAGVVGSHEFVFVIFPLAKPPAYGEGMAFVVASKTDLMAKGTATSGLGLFNPGNKNITENQILAVELDISESSEQFYESDNHKAKEKPREKNDEEKVESKNRKEMNVTRYELLNINLSH